MTEAPDWPDLAAWRAGCADDPVLAAWRGPWSVCFAIADGNPRRFAFRDGRIATGDDGGATLFTLAAPPHAWRHFRAIVPARHHHSVFAMLMRVPGAAVAGDALGFAQYCHVVRRVLDIGRWLARGGAAPAPVSLRPPGAGLPAPATRGGYVGVAARGTDYTLFHERAGAGRDLLCLHTAGADARQFHGLMADARLTARHRLVAFDMPWHGKSPPPAGAPPGAWRLDTDLYVDLVMGFIAAAGLHRPVLLGASMSGEICLELALRHPEQFAAIVACEATDNIQGRQTPWAAHPAVNQAYFIPEWIEGLMAPQSPAACAQQILWHYAQGGPAVFSGDIAFYSGDWDARDRVHRIDTSRCPLFMLTGEYDYSCTVEQSAATAAKISGARFTPIPGIGHFPFAENPALFLDYLLPILEGF